MNDELKQGLEVVRDPATYSWLTYAWVCLIAAWGGLVRFLNSMRERKESLGASLLTLLTGLITSVFVGVLTFYACEIASVDKLYTAICVAITGHLGAHAMQIFEKAAVNRLKAIIGAGDVGPDKETP